MQKVTIEDYQAKLKGISFPVKNAEIEKCDACGAELYGAKEIRRWERLFDEYLLESGLILNPKQITSIRNNLGLSVIDFAQLLGVTRQAVYSWERDETKPLSIGPTSLLLSLLLEEQKRNIRGIADFLVKSAKDRGVEIQTETPNIPFSKGHLRTIPSGGPSFATKALCLN
jgi:putative zinc finger/helix-turn-helix YgiT family protein